MGGTRRRAECHLHKWLWSREREEIGVLREVVYVVVDGVKGSRESGPRKTEFFYLCLPRDLVMRSFFIVLDTAPNCPFACYCSVTFTLESLNVLLVYIYLPLMAVQSFKVIDFCTNRKPIYDFLLVINCNLSSSYLSRLTLSTLALIDTINGFLRISSSKLPC